jgi:hypothetical protein
MSTRCQPSPFNTDLLPLAKVDSKKPKEEIKDSVQAPARSKKTLDEEDPELI